jgi:hypothetical protein
MEDRIDASFAPVYTGENGLHRLNKDNDYYIWGGRDLTNLAAIIARGVEASKTREHRKVYETCFEVEG